ncbi:Phosphatase YidA [Hafnia alvei]|uniref:Phosphatase YidA n=1 Tax=Hafnia alvei TaxID=569 RepID=A0A377PF85_HAFAL|nr:Phosphatase YidA [Hafnia alvei]
MPKTGEPLFETLLDNADYLYLESLSRQVGSHFHALDHHKLYTANRDVSKYTVHESFITGIPLHFCPADEMDKSIHFPKVMMIDHPEVLDAAIARIPPEAYERYTMMKSSPYFPRSIEQRCRQRERHCSFGAVSEYSTRKRDVHWRSRQ